MYWSSPRWEILWTQGWDWTHRKAVWAGPILKDSYARTNWMLQKLQSIREMPEPLPLCALSCQTSHARELSGRHFSPKRMARPPSPPLASLRKRLAIFVRVKVQTLVSWLSSCNEDQRQMQFSFAKERLKLTYHLKSIKFSSSPVLKNKTQYLRTAHNFSII